MAEDRQVGDLIDLSSRSRYRPDIAGLARSQITAARESLDLKPGEFAELLTPLVGWPVTSAAVESWETATVPPGDVLIAAGLMTRNTAPESSRPYGTDLLDELSGKRFSDLTAVYASRSEFMSKLPAHILFDDASNIRAAGLSLNLICQEYADQKLRQLITGGTTMQCLFLDPGGAAIKSREQEEGHPVGHLSTLTELNIQILAQRVRHRLPPEAQERLRIAVYDETIRFNIILIDDQTCVMQPYLPGTRGIDSPTFLIHRRWSTAGLFPIFDQLFTSLWERSRSL